MYEKYTEAARRVIFFGRYEANKAKDKEMKPEHLLLGITREDRKILGRFLKDDPLALKLKEVIVSKIENLREDNPDAPNIPFSEESKRVLEEAALCTVEFRHPLIHPVHILLGILKEGKGVSAEILTQHGISTPIVKRYCSVMPVSSR